ncbi:hypothetical protein Tco_0835928, partial [Tanacetum coccineum]
MLKLFEILDICPRVQGVDYAEVPDDKNTLTFLIDLGYKGLLYKHPSIKGKGSQGKKIVVSLKPVSDEESDKSHLELKSMSLTEATEKEAARQVHVTHERIVIESDPEPARRRPLGCSTLTPEEKLAADTMQTLKESKKSSKSQSLTGGSSEGTGVSLGVLDESTVIPTTSSKGTSTKPGVPDEKKDEVKKDDDDIDDDKSINLKKTNDEETDDEFVHGEEQVNDDEDEEMSDAEVRDSEKSDEEIIDAAKADAQKAEEVKNDIKKVELPPSGSSLSVSSGFGNHSLPFYDTFLIGTVKDTTGGEINSLLDVQIQQEIPHIQSPSVLNVHVSVIFELSVLTPIPKTPLVALATTLLPPPSVSTIPPIPLQPTTLILTPPITTKAPPVTINPYPLYAVIQRVSVLEKEVHELKEADNAITLRALLKSEIPTTIKAYLGSSLGDALQKVLQKHTEELIQKYPQQVDYKEIINDSLQVNLINEVNNQLPQLLPKAEFLFLLLCLDDAIARGQADPEKVLRKRDRDDKASVGPDQGKKTKRSKTKESEPSKKSSTSKESSKGKSSIKTSKSGKSVNAEEPVEEP